MKSKALVSTLIVVGSAAITWLLGEAIGQIALGGSKQYTAWRAAHVGMVLGIWIAATVVVMVCALWVFGRRLLALNEERERALAEAKGVGRITIQALRGSEAAADKLVLLLKDQSRPVRYQAARALAMLDDEDINPTLFKTVRYWPGNEKLELIDVLKRTSDIRTAKLLNELARDRSPYVSRKARTALPLVMGRVSRGVTKDEDEARRSHRINWRSKPAAADGLPLRAAPSKPAAPGGAVGSRPSATSKGAATAQHKATSGAGTAANKRAATTTARPAAKKPAAAGTARPAAGKPAAPGGHAEGSSTDRPARPARASQPRTKAAPKSEPPAGPTPPAGP